LADLEALRGKLQAIEAELAFSDDQGDLSPKKPNGRLTEAGIKRLFAMMEGGYSNAEIASELDIRHTSVIPYRQRFVHERSRRNRSPRGRQ
jgi:hypothetical protein